ncbi:MAG TPA: TolC family protein [Prolixibacteraceae bacterium]|nr:TolC family protein [Prolixibacteraceae bacterium]
MKTIQLLFIVLLFPVHLLMAQETVTLEQCQNWARENHPVLKQLDLYQQILNFKNENNSTSMLPQVSLNGQATYQSDVTKIGISIPNMNIPTVGKDQYKFYLDFKQTIWDGGLSKAKELINQAENGSNQQQAEVEIYQVKEKVNQFFFTSFLIQENLKILEKKTETLAERRKLMESAVNNGMVLSSELDQLLAELIKTEQLVIELKSNRETVLYALSILTGKTADQMQNLVIPEEPLVLGMSLKRPELDFFSKQNNLLSANSEILKKQRNPKLFGFGQAGYGKPGMNMLNTKFDTYYLVGVGFSWNVLDWKTTSRQQQVLKLQQDIIQTKQETFIQNIDLATNQQTKQISQISDLLKTDQELIQIRERITKTSASKLENGTITMADYIQDLNAETTAKLTLETRKIQLKEAKVKLDNIRGNQ